MVDRLHLNCFRNASKSFTNLSCTKEDKSPSSATGEPVIYEPSKPTLTTLVTSSRKPLMQFVSLEEQSQTPQTSEPARLPFRKRSQFARQTSDQVSCGSQRLTSWFSPRRKTPLRLTESNQSADCILFSPPVGRARFKERRHSRSLRLPKRESPEISTQEILTRNPDVIISCHGEYCYLRGSLPNVSDDMASSNLALPNNLLQRHDSSSSIDSEEDARLRFPCRSRRLAIAETLNCGDVSPSALSPAYSDDEENEQFQVFSQNSQDATASNSNKRNRQGLRRPLNKCSKSLDAVTLQQNDNADADADADAGLLKQPAKSSASSSAATNANLPPTNLIGSFCNPQKQHGRILRRMITVTEMSPCSTTSCKRPVRQFTKSKAASKSPIVEALNAIKPSFFKDVKLASYKDKHWTTLVQDNSSKADAYAHAHAHAQAVVQNGTDMTVCCAASSPCSAFSILSVLKITEQERRRREAVWELFVSELVFLVDHLMVLKHTYIELLKKMQVDGFLMFAEPHELFGNADELCYVSYTFCRDFMSQLKESTMDQFGPTHVVIEALNGWIQHSRDGEVYHDYCLNYYSAINYLEEMRRHEDFCEYEKWCQANERCRRLQLTDLLAAPMQHCTKIPLLVGNLIKYTQDPQEKTELLTIMQKIQSSLQQLDEKIKRLFNFDRLRQLQKQVHWPTVMEMNPSSYIPNKLKDSLSQQPCVELLANPKRTLLKEGPVAMIEHDKRLDLYMFLFDDVLLLTKCKKKPPKKSALSLHKSPTDGWEFKVCKQPIPLDRVCILDIEKPENGLEKHAWLVVHTTRFRQIIGAYTLQAANDATKLAWISFIQDAQNTLLQRITTEMASNNVPSNGQSGAAEQQCSPQKLESRSSTLAKSSACNLDTASCRTFTDAQDTTCDSCVGDDCLLPKKEARRNAVDLSSVRANLLDSPDGNRPQCLQVAANAKRSVPPYRTVFFSSMAHQSSSASSVLSQAPRTSTEVSNAESCAFKLLLLGSPREPRGWHSQVHPLQTLQSPVLGQVAGCSEDSPPFTRNCSLQSDLNDRASRSAVLPKKKISLGAAPSGSSNCQLLRFRKMSKPLATAPFAQDHEPPASADSNLSLTRLFSRSVRMPQLRSSSTASSDSHGRYTQNRTDEND